MSNRSLVAAPCVAILVAVAACSSAPPPEEEVSESTDSTSSAITVTTSAGCTFSVSSCGSGGVSGSTTAAGHATIKKHVQAIFGDESKLPPPPARMSRGVDYYTHYGVKAMKEGLANGTLKFEHCGSATVCGFNTTWLKLYGTVPPYLSGIGSSENVRYTIGAMIENVYKGNGAYGFAGYNFQTYGYIDPPVPNLTQELTTSMASAAASYASPDTGTTTVYKFPSTSASCGSRVGGEHCTPKAQAANTEVKGLIQRNGSYCKCVCPPTGC